MRKELSRGAAFFLKEWTCPGMGLYRYGGSAGKAFWTCRGAKRAYGSRALMTPECSWRRSDWVFQRIVLKG